MSLGGSRLIWTTKSFMLRYDSETVEILKPEVIKDTPQFNFTKGTIIQVSGSDEIKSIKWFDVRNEEINKSDCGVILVLTGTGEVTIYKSDINPYTKRWIKHSSIKRDGVYISAVHAVTTRKNCHDKLELVVGFENGDLGVYQYQNEQSTWSLVSMKNISSYKLTKLEYLRQSNSTLEGENPRELTHILAVDIEGDVYEVTIISELGEIQGFSQIVDGFGYGPINEVHSYEGAVVLAGIGRVVIVEGSDIDDQNHEIQEGVASIRISTVGLPISQYITGISITKKSVQEKATKSVFDVYSIIISTNDGQVFVIEKLEKLQGENQPCHEDHVQDCTMNDSNDVALSSKPNQWMRIGQKKVEKKLNRIVDKQIRSILSRDTRYGHTLRTQGSLKSVLVSHNGRYIVFMVAGILRNDLYSKTNLVSVITCHLNPVIVNRMFYFDPASYTGMTEKSTLISSHRYEHDRVDLSEAKPQIQNKILQSVKDSLDKSDDSAYSGNMFDNDEFNSRGINKIMSQYNDESGGGSIQDTCDTTITFNKDLTERANGKGSNMTIEYLLWDIINQDYREIENKLIKRLDKNYENVYDNLVYNVYYYQYHHNHENNCGKKANNKSSKYTDLHARSFSSKNEVDSGKSAKFYIYDQLMRCKYRILNKHLFNFSVSVKEYYLKNPISSVSRETSDIHLENLRYLKQINRLFNSWKRSIINNFQHSQSNIKGVGKSRKSKSHQYTYLYILEDGLEEIITIINPIILQLEQQLSIENSDGDGDGDGCGDNDSQYKCPICKSEFIEFSCKTNDGHIIDKQTYHSSKRDDGSDDDNDDSDDSDDILTLTCVNADKYPFHKFLLCQKTFMLLTGIDFNTCTFCNSKAVLPDLSNDVNDRIACADISLPRFVTQKHCSSNKCLFCKNFLLSTF